MFFLRAFTVKNYPYPGVCVLAKLCFLTSLHKLYTGKLQKKNINMYA